MEVTLTGLGLRALAIGLGNEKGEKELVAGGFDVDVVYGSPETSSKQWSKQLNEDQLGKQTVCLVVDEAHSVSAWFWRRSQVQTIQKQNLCIDTIK